MTYNSRKQTGTADAALILSHLKDRVDKLEKEKHPDESDVQLFRKVTDTITCTDTTTVTEQSASAFVFGESEWNFDEFGTTQ